MPRGVEAGPGVDAGIAGIHRDGVERPLQGSGFRIERLDEAGRVHVVPGADNHVIAEDHRSVGREVLLVEAGDLLLPNFLAVARVETYHPVVVQLEVEIVVPHAEAASLEAGADPRLPVVMPMHGAVARVDSPHIIGRGSVNRAVGDDDSAAESRRPAIVRLSRSEAADHDGRWWRP